MKATIERQRQSLEGMIEYRHSLIAEAEREAARMDTRGNNEIANFYRDQAEQHRAQIDRIRSVIAELR